MGIDYEAMNQRIKDLADQNSTVFTGSLPTAQQVTTSFGMGNTVTTTPNELSEIQKALSGQGGFKLGNVTSMNPARGTPSFKTDAQGQQTLAFTPPKTYSTSMFDSGLPSNTPTYGLNSLQAQSDDQLLQMMKSVGIANPEGLLKGMNMMKKAQMSAGLVDYQAEQKSSEQHQKNYQAGLETVGAGVASMGQELDQVGALIKEQMNQGLSPVWERAMGKADEYVQNAQNRTVQAMQELDSNIKAMKDDMRFEKAHDMQVATQTALGQMNDYGDVISRRYGQDSPEYQQFTQQKSSTLATTQSSIHATYGQLNASMNQGFLTTRAQLSGNMAMYENYNEQASLEVYKTAAAADQQYELNATSQLITIEQLKMSGQTLLADWMANTPVFSMSVSGLLSFLA